MKNSLIIFVIFAFYFSALGEVSRLSLEDKKNCAQAAIKQVLGEKFIFTFISDPEIAVFDKARLSRSEQSYSYIDFGVEYKRDHYKGFAYINYSTTKSFTNNSTISSNAENGMQFTCTILKRNNIKNSSRPLSLTTFYEEIKSVNRELFHLELQDESI